MSAPPPSPAAPMPATPSLPPLPPHEPVAELGEIGVLAFTTTRAAGTFGLSGSDPVGEVMLRWAHLADAVSPSAHRIASLRQVHGATVVVHTEGWRGWLRVPDADGHVTRVPGTAMTVGVADCIPIFIAHPSGACGILHSGWRGTAGRILEQGIARMKILGCAPADLVVHLGPAVCGKCYEVGPDVYAQLTGRTADAPTRVDLRAIVTEQARRCGVRNISATSHCTRCDNDRYFSHRAGDSGRQVGVIVAPEARRRSG